MEIKMRKSRPDRSLSCELMPNGNIGFVDTNPVGPANPMTISGILEPNGRITGQQSEPGPNGKRYVTRTGEPGAASDILEHETLPRAVKPCMLALKP